MLIPGVKVTRLLQPAAATRAGPAAAPLPAAFSFRQQIPSPAAFADPAATAPMARAFTLAGPAKLQLQADALALPGPGLDALLDRISPPGPACCRSAWPRPRARGPPASRPA